VQVVDAAGEGQHGSATQAASSVTGMVHIGGVLCWSFLSIALMSMAGENTDCVDCTNEPGTLLRPTSCELSLSAANETCCSSLRL
jgi:hypothetical protein